MIEVYLRLKNLFRRINNKQFFEFLIVLVIGTLEFLIIYRGDLPPGFAFSVIPKSVEIKLSSSVYADGYSENNILFLLAPILLAASSSFNSSMLLYLTFVLGILSMFYFIRYASLKYMDVRDSNILLLTGIVIASLYVNTYYFSGGTFFNYSLYYSLVPFILIALDKYFNTNNESKVILFRQSLIIGIVLGLSTLDIRTLVYNVFVFVYFLFFTIIYEHNITRFKRSIFMAFSILIIYVLINIKFILVIFAEKATGGNILSSVVPAQIYIALQRYSLLYSIAGAQTWYTTYNIAFIYLGLIPFFIGLTLILNSKMKKITALLYIAIIILILFSISGGNTISFYVAQTKLYPYLTIIYPYFVMGSLYDPFLYMLFGLAFFNIVRIVYNYLSGKSFLKNIKNKNNKTSKAIRIAAVVIIIFIISMPIEYYLEPEEASLNTSNHTVDLPPYIQNITNYIYSSGLSGNIFLYGAVSGQNTYFAYIPNIIWSNYPASPSNVFKFILSTHTENLGKVLAYFGVQYMIYIYDGNSSMLNYITGQSTMKLITQQHGVFLFKNMLYSEILQFKNSLYIGFDMPYIFKYLNNYSQFIPIMPFYSVNNFSSIEDYVTGIVGINISSNKILPLFLNKYNSFRIDTGAMTINDWPNGWGIAPDGGIGSNVNAIYPYSNKSLGLKSNIPEGDYFVVAEGGSFRYGYGISDSSLEITSGNSSSIVYFNQTMFSPYVQFSSYSTINVTNSNIYIKPASGTPFVSNIYFITINNYNAILRDVNSFMDSHKIISVNNGSLIIKNNNINSGGKNFISSIIFTDEISPAGSFFNTIDVKNSIYHFTYNYGLGEGYITLNMPEISVNDSSASYLLYISASIDLALLALLYKIRKIKS